MLNVARDKNTRKKTHILYITNRLSIFYVSLPMCTRFISDQSQWRVNAGRIYMYPFIFLPFLFIVSFLPPSLTIDASSIFSFSLAVSSSDFPFAHIKLAGFFFFHFPLASWCCALEKILCATNTRVLLSFFHGGVVICSTKPCDYLSFFSRFFLHKRRPAVSSFTLPVLNQHKPFGWMMDERRL